MDVLIDSLFNRYEDASKRKMSIIYFANDAINDTIGGAIDMLSFSSPLMRIGDAMKPQDVSIKKIRNDISDHSLLTNLPNKASIVKRYLTRSRNSL